MSRTTPHGTHASTHLNWGRPSSGFAIPRRLYTADSPVRPSVKRVSSSSPSVWRFTQMRSSSRADRSACGSARSRTRRASTNVQGDRVAAQCALARRLAVPRRCLHPRNSCLARRGALQAPFAPSGVPVPVRTRGRLPSAYWISGKNEVNNKAGQLAHAAHLMNVVALFVEALVAPSTA